MFQTTNQDVLFTFLEISGVTGLTCPLSTPDSKSPADSCGAGLPRIILKPSNSTTHFMNLDLKLRPAHDMVPFCTVSSLSLAAVRFSRKLSCRNTWQRWWFGCMKSYQSCQRFQQSEFDHPKKSFLPERHPYLDVHPTKWCIIHI